MILVVDDDAVCRKLASKFLQVLGCTIDIAADGSDALRMLALGRYDLVLMVRIRP